MITYEFYSPEYGGTLITLAEFPKASFLAEETYRNFTLKPRLTEKLLQENESGANAIRFALCEIMDNNKRGEDLLEKAYQNDQLSALGVRSEGVKDHSLSFEASKELKSNNINEEIAQTNAQTMRKYLFRYGLLYRGL